MVKIQKTADRSKRSWKNLLPFVVALGLFLYFELGDDASPPASSLSQITSDSITKQPPPPPPPPPPPEVDVLKKDPIPDSASIPQKNVKCPYLSLDDLTEEELNPVKSSRHMVDPPKGGSVHLVCCDTTKGKWNFVIREKWAPKGANRVLEMVKTGYFNAGVPMMRCLKNFLCQFGLNNDPALSKQFRQNLEDDPNWLPEGPTHRTNEEGVVRFAHGYMAYAGGGKNSRTQQLIVSLKPVPTLAGGSPWEVPWGELVGKHSFETLSKIYYGYGEQGPSQGKLMNRGMTDEMKQEFPLLDYINSCAVVDERIEA